MKKIIIFTYNLHIGGIQKSLINFIKCLQEKYQITLFVFSKNGQYKDFLPRNIEIITGPKELLLFGCGFKELFRISFVMFLKKMLTRIKMHFYKKELLFEKILKKYVPNEHFDAAISFQQNGPGNSFMFGCNYLCLACNAKTKLTFIHSDFENAMTGTDYNITEYKKFDFICSVSETGKATLEKYFDNAKLIVCKNTHLIEQILSMSKQYKIDRKQNCCHFVTISRISDEKGIDRIIEVSKYLNLLKLPFFWTVVGDGPNLKKYKAIVKRDKIDNLLFVGSKENPYPYLLNSDYLVISSYHEASPMVVQEAQILNKNVLAVNYSSAKEFLCDECVCDNSLNSLKQLISKAAKNYPRKIVSFDEQYTQETNFSNLQKIMEII